MADQDDGRISETAAASSLRVDGNETITVDQQREDDSGAAGEGERVTEGGREETRPGIESAERTPVDSEAKTNDAGPAQKETSESGKAESGKDASQESKKADHASLAQVETDVQSPSPPPASQKEESTVTPQADTEPTMPPATLKAASIHASSTIHRTASPAYSQSSVTSTQGKEGVASPSLAAPKKFSTVNINKKFLGKTGGAPQAVPSAASSQMGNKESSLGLVNLSGEFGRLCFALWELIYLLIARPSPTLAQQQSSSRILTSAKLTSVIPSKTSSVTGGLTTAPTAGWAKPVIPGSAKSTPIGINGPLSPRTTTPVNAATRPSVEGPSTGTATTRTPLGQSSGLPTSSGLPATAAPTAIRLTNQGPSATRHLISLNPVKQPIKRGWQTISPNPESAQEQARNESSTGHGPFGQARFKQSIVSDFPTALEVMEGQRSAVVHAQQAAQAKAAHNQAILEGLNAFRGTNKDPAVHGWDEASFAGYLIVIF